MMIVEAKSVATTGGKEFFPFIWEDDGYVSQAMPYSTDAYLSPLIREQRRARIVEWEDPH